MMAHRTYKYVAMSHLYFVFSYFFSKPYLASYFDSKLWVSAQIYLGSYELYFSREQVKDELFLTFYEIIHLIGSEILNYLLDADINLDLPT